MDEQQPQPSPQPNLQLSKPTGVMPPQPIEAKPKPDRYKQSLKFVGWLQFIIFAGCVSFYIYLILLARSGASGTELMALLLLPFFALLAALALVNLICLPIWLLRRKPEIKIWWILSLVLSMLLFALGAFTTYQYQVVAPKKIAQFDAELKAQNEQFEKEMEAIKTNTKEEALQLMGACKVQNFVGYNGDLSLVHANVREWVKSAEQTASGIRIYTNDKGLSYIYTSKAMTQELLISARQAREKCMSQQELIVYIDDIAESYYNGVWVPVKVRQ